MTKVCSKCKEEKTLDQYGKNCMSKDGLRPDCRSCKSIQRKEYYRKNQERSRLATIKWGEKNPEKKSDAGKAWYSKNKDRHKESGKKWLEIPGNKERCAEVAFDGGLKRRYGMSPDDYYSKLSAQGGKCAIPSCSRDPESRALSVDHDHSTGSVRGLLCTNCNAALGLVDDNQEILQDLIHYLNMYDGSSHGGFVASIYASDQSN